MSFDRHIDQVCPHQIIEEPLFIGGDRQTISPKGHIASSNSVRVRLNGEIEVPPYGAFCPIRVTGRMKEPFFFKAGDNDHFTIQTHNRTKEVRLGMNGHFSAHQVVQVLNRQIKEVTFQALGKQVQVQSGDEGPQATLSFDGPLTQVLGFSNRRVWRGVQVAPGWTLVTDPRTLDDRPRRLIVFDEPLRSDGFVEIDYVTVKQECRRCGGTGYEHDWRYSKEGNTGEVRHEALLLQELQTLIFTVKGSNPFHRQFGTSIIDAIGKKQVNVGLTASLLESDITMAFNMWQSIKRQQENVVGQHVSDEEFPNRLVGVDVRPSAKDPTVMFIDITVQNRSGRRVDLSRGFKLPYSMAEDQYGLIRDSINKYVQVG